MLKKIRWIQAIVVILYCHTTTQILLGQNLHDPRLFYGKISGMYQDNKTSEMVFLYQNSMGFVMFYQPNPYCPNFQVKALEQVSLDVAKERIQVQFVKSNYRCTFSFASDYQSFICKNPDGSKQKFKRTAKTIDKPFAYFLSFFPKHPKAQYQVPVQLSYDKPIPVQVAWKFISHVNFDDEEINERQRKGLIKAALCRLFLGTSQTQEAGYLGRTTYFATKQLPLNSNFISLLISEKGYAYGGESVYEMTYLANFTKDGKLIQMLPVGGKAIGIDKSEWHLKSKINGSQINVREAFYQMHYLSSGQKPFLKFENKKTTHYTILPSGKLQKK